MLTRPDPYNEEVQAPHIFLTSLPVLSPPSTAYLFHLKTRRRLAGVNGDDKKCVLSSAPLIFGNGNIGTRPVHVQLV